MTPSVSDLMFTKIPPLARFCLPSFLALFLLLVGRSSCTIMRWDPMIMGCMYIRLMVWRWTSMG